MNNIHLLIDGRELSKRRGMGHFTREIVYNVESNPNPNVIVWCVTRKNTSATIGYKLSNIKIIEIDNYNPILWEQVLIPLIVLKYKITHVLCPYNTFPIFLPRATKRLIVYHDLIFLHYNRIKSSITLRVGNMYRSALTHLLSKDDTLLTVSDFSRDLIRRFLHRSAIVIGNDVNHIMPQMNEYIPRKFTDDYLLHVGGDASTKNTIPLMRAYIQAKQHNPQIPLLVVMGISHAFAKSAQRNIRSDHIHFEVNISDAEKFSLYKYARAILFPSLKEGFGLPIIEAHAFGKRVLTSRRRPMSDIASSEDILVDPTSIESIASGISAISTLDGVENTTSPRPHQSDILYSALL